MEKGIWRSEAKTQSPTPESPKHPPGSDKPPRPCPWLSILSPSSDKRGVEPHRFGRPSRTANLYLLAPVRCIFKSRPPASMTGWRKTGEDRWPPWARHRSPGAGTGSWHGPQKGLAWKSHEKAPAPRGASATPVAARIPRPWKTGKRRPSIPAHGGGNDGLEDAPRPVPSNHEGGNPSERAYPPMIRPQARKSQPEVETLALRNGTQGRRHETEPPANETFAGVNETRKMRLLSVAGEVSHWKSGSIA